MYRTLLFWNIIIILLIIKDKPHRKTSYFNVVFNFLQNAGAGAPQIWSPSPPHEVGAYASEYCHYYLQRLIIDSLTEQDGDEYWLIVNWYIFA